MFSASSGKVDSLTSFIVFLPIMMGILVISKIVGLLSFLFGLYMFFAKKGQSRKSILLIILGILLVLFFKKLIGEYSMKVSEKITLKH